MKLNEEQVSFAKRLEDTAYQLRHGDNVKSIVTHLDECGYLVERLKERIGPEMISNALALIRKSIHYAHPQVSVNGPRTEDRLVVGEYGTQVALHPIIIVPISILK